MNMIFKGAVAAALISVSASVFGAAVAEASPKTDTQGQTGSKVDKDGTNGVIDRDGTQGDFLDATQGGYREATQGDMTGPLMTAGPGIRAGG
jgi:hypothetical protein